MRVVSRRLGTLRDHGWLSLVADLQAYYEAAAPQRGSRSAERQHPAQGGLSQAAAQAAVIRARTGSLKGAAAIPTGGPPVPLQ